MKAGEGKPLTLVILRNGIALAPVVAHPAKIQAGGNWASLPQPAFRNDPLPSAKRWSSPGNSAGQSLMIFDVLAVSFTHKVSVSQLAGCGHRSHAGDAARQRAGGQRLGWRNDQPQPRHPQSAALPDSRRWNIFFLLIESAIRRDISIPIKERIISGIRLAVGFFASSSSTHYPTAVIHSRKAVTKPFFGSRLTRKCSAPCHSERSVASRRPAFLLFWRRGGRAQPRLCS